MVGNSSIAKFVIFAETLVTAISKIMISQGRSFCAWGTMRLAFKFVRRYESSVKNAGPRLELGTTPQNLRRCYQKSVRIQGPRLRAGHHTPKSTTPLRKFRENVGSSIRATSTRAGHHTPTPLRKFPLGAGAPYNVAARPRSWRAGRGPGAAHCPQNLEVSLCKILKSKRVSKLQICVLHRPSAKKTLRSLRDGTSRCLKVFQKLAFCIYPLPKKS